MTSLLDNPAVRSAVMPITVEQYRRMGQLGVISERTELLRGIIIQKMNKSPLHVWTVRRLRALVDRQLPTGVYIRQEEPLSLPHSEPEPNLALVEGVDTDHRTEHPSSALLVIEVALTSKEIDREKAELYAEAGVPEYWLVSPDERALKRFTRPAGQHYTETELLSYDVEIESTTEPRVKVDLAELS